MGFLRFRRSIPLGRFLRLNVSKTGTSLSAGKPGATINVGKNGVDGTVGVPGTGLSYKQRLAGRGGCLSVLALGLLGLFSGCSTDGPRPPEGPTFSDDVDLLREHADAVVLEAPTGGRVLVSPKYQGRVMTSAFGEDEPGNGWVNRAAVADPTVRPHINVYGGEERFWLGPEGGQFGLFFAPGAPFTFERWQTPALLDTTPWPVTARTATSVSLAIHTEGTRLRLRLDRTVRVLATAAETAAALGVRLPEGVEAVGYVTDNGVTNTGDAPWDRETGVPSVWMLGMLRHGPQARIVIPVRPGPDSALGPRVNDNYFGKIAKDRLVARENFVVLRADGASRGKIGVGPRRARDTLGAWNPETGILTVVRFSHDPQASEYVDSSWAEQRNPLGGDVVNAYNDGPTPTGAPLGPFFELESSSPALPLVAGQRHVHRQATVHLRGDRGSLDTLARALLGAGLDEIEGAL